MNERELFLAALEIEDPVARQAHLQSACAGDAALLSRVESLLGSHEGNSAFLKTPVGEQLESGAESKAFATLNLANSSPQDADAFQNSAAQGVEHMKEEIPLGFLLPSTKPNSLGRLPGYEILQVIGRGTFGIVLRAVDDKLQRVVAIKVLAPEFASTSPPRKRFLREAQISAAIRHENVVAVHTVGEAPLPFLVMDFIPGVTLQERLYEQGPLDVASVLHFGRQIAEGLAAAHAKGLIHRDIKPANILIEPNVPERVKITDFGLARAADDASLTESGIIAGTPMYMAPEQANGHKLDHRADLFSFGSVLYEMVSGRPPFRAPTTPAVLKRVVEEKPRPIHEIIPETPAWLCDIIAKLHAKDPDDRYQTAREVADLLADCDAKPKAKQEVREHLPPRYQVDGPAVGSTAAVQLLSVIALVVVLASLAIWGRPSGPGDVTPGAGTSQQQSDRTDAEREAAEILRKHNFRLVIRTPNRTTTTVNPDNPLPIEPFAVLECTPNDQEKLPPDFVRTVLIPSIANLTNFGAIHDNWMVTTWTEDDLAELAASSVAANLYAVRGGYRLTPKNLETLKLFPRLTNIACFVGPDAALARLPELPAVDWIEMTAKDTKAYKLSPEQWAGVAECRLRGVLLNGVEIDDTAATRIAEMQALTNLSLWHCPGTRASLPLLAANPSVRELVLGAAITDSDLEPLAKFTQLHRLKVRSWDVSEKVTEAAAKKLASSLPRCEIEWDTGAIKPMSILAE